MNVMQSAELLCVFELVAVLHVLEPFPNPRRVGLLVFHVFTEAILAQDYIKQCFATSLYAPDMWSSAV
jgi:hypothetical protein